MAFPDDYRAWGGTTADFVVSLHRLGAGVNLVKAAEAPVALFAGSGVEAAPIVDVRTPTGEPIAVLRSDPSGNLPEFWIPAEHLAVWVQVGVDGPRLLLVPRTAPAGVDPDALAAAVAAYLAANPPVTSSSWDDVTDKPVTFPPADHDHTTDEVTGLDDFVRTTIGATITAVTEDQLPPVEDRPADAVYLVVEA